MHKTYFEDLERAETREAERRLLFTALQERQTPAWPHGFIATILWLFGVTR